ncbi:lysophospholipid acyltransferase family protein [Treponema sp. R6D11]
MYHVIKGIVSLYLRIFHRFEVRGKENIPEGPAVLCPNHIAAFDGALIACAYKPKLYFLAKKEIFKFKPFGAIVKFLGGISVDRGKADTGAIKKGLTALEKSRKLIVFPQGHRYKEFEVSQGKRGAAALATMANCPIIPTTIHRIGKFIPKKMIITFYEPIYADGRTEREFIGAVMEKIGENL